MRSRCELIFVLGILVYFYVFMTQPKDNSMLVNFRKCKQEIMMETEVWSKDIGSEGDVLEYGVTMYFDPSAVMNFYGVSGLDTKGNHVYIYTKKYILSL